MGFLLLLILTRYTCIVILFIVQDKLFTAHEVRHDMGAIQKLLRDAAPSFTGLNHKYEEINKVSI